MLLIAPLAAEAAIYQWTDEQGRVVFGNQVPESGVTNVRTVVKDDPLAAAMDANRAAEERIARLERQVQALQSTSPAPYPAPSPYPAAQYAPMPATGPDYYPGSYYPGMYSPPYYPFGYAYPYGVVRVVRPVHRFAGSPRFASHPHAAFHHAAMPRR